MHAFGVHEANFFVFHTVLGCTLFCLLDVGEFSVAVHCVPQILLAPDEHARRLGKVGVHRREPLGGDVVKRFLVVDGVANEKQVSAERVSHVTPDVRRLAVSSVLERDGHCLSIDHHLLVVCAVLPDEIVVAVEVSSCVVDDEAGFPDLPVAQEHDFQIEFPADLDVERSSHRSCVDVGRSVRIVVRVHGLVGRLSGEVRSLRLLRCCLGTAGILGSVRV